MQKFTKFKVIFDLFTVCVYFIQQQNYKLYNIYLMIISEIQSEIGHYSCDSANFKAPADFSHHAILLFDIVLNILLLRLRLHIYDHHCKREKERTRDLQVYIAYSISTTVLRV